MLQCGVDKKRPVNRPSQGNIISSVARVRCSGHFAGASNPGLGRGVVSGSGIIFRAISGLEAYLGCLKMLESVHLLTYSVFIECLLVPRFRGKHRGDRLAGRGCIEMKRRITPQGEVREDRGCWPAGGPHPSGEGVGPGPEREQEPGEGRGWQSVFRDRLQHNVWEGRAWPSKGWRRSGWRVEGE